MLACAHINIQYSMLGYTISLPGGLSSRQPLRECSSYRKNHSAFNVAPKIIFLTCYGFIKAWLKTGKTIHLISAYQKYEKIDIIF